MVMPLEVGPSPAGASHNLEEGSAPRFLGTFPAEAQSDLALWLPRSMEPFTRIQVAAYSGFGPGRLDCPVLPQPTATGHSKQKDGWDARVKIQFSFYSWFFGEKDPEALNLFSATLAVKTSD